MSLLVWVLLFAVTSLFWIWVLFLGGAERLEGTWASAWLIDWFAPNWSAAGIKLFGLVAWVATAIWFVVGLLAPPARFWW
jgi:hypothetical protein